ncbi:unnamed protein product [Miscanthus lutarioriparius]|uniref:Uncharacterized protein n=1 Tax=Miscanthus lutarioriparius TaxID=422564 RepID=A0A811MFE6_9POAL|nr:unnamed protein product [Miscanthus lutarioriparius]
MSSRIYMLRSTIEEAKFRFWQTEQSSLDNEKGPSLRLYLGAAEVGCSVIQELLPSEDHGEEDVDSICKGCSEGSEQGWGEVPVQVRVAVEPTSVLRSTDRPWSAPEVLVFPSLDLGLHVHHGCRGPGVLPLLDRGRLRGRVLPVAVAETPVPVRACDRALAREREMESEDIEERRMEPPRRLDEGSPALRGRRLRAQMPAGAGDDGARAAAARPAAGGHGGRVGAMGARWRRGQNHGSERDLAKGSTRAGRGSERACEEHWARV